MRRYLAACLIASATAIAASVSGVQSLRAASDASHPIKRVGMVVGIK